MISQVGWNGIGVRVSLCVGSFAREQALTGAGGASSSHLCMLLGNCQRRGSRGVQRNAPGRGCLNVPTASRSSPFSSRLAHAWLVPYVRPRVWYFPRPRLVSRSILMSGHDRFFAFSRRWGSDWLEHFLRTNFQQCCHMEGMWKRQRTYPNHLGTHFSHWLVFRQRKIR